MKNKIAAAGFYLAASMFAVEAEPAPATVENFEATTATVGFHGEEQFVTPVNQILPPESLAVLNRHSKKSVTPS